MKKATHPQRVFLSYRRVDNPGLVGWIKDRLKTSFGADGVFSDEEIPYAENFERHIAEQISKCDIMLVIIGKKWLTEGTKHSKHGEKDYVHFEVETAFSHGLRILPVLIDGAKMPTAKDLPSTLSDLPLQHAATVDHGKDFESHVADLIATINALRGKDVGRRKRIMRMAGLVVAIVACVAAVTLSIRYFSTPTKPIESVAILPLTAEPASIQYLAEGISEEIARKLSQLPYLRVVSPTALSDTGSIKRISSMMRVDATVGGTVTREGNNLFVDVEFGTLDGKQLWAEHYTRSFAGIGELLEEIPLRVVSHLDIPKADSIIRSAKTSCVALHDAYDKYLQGRFLRRKHSKEENALSIQYYTEAITRDPQCVAAIIGLANAQVGRYENNWTSDVSILLAAENNAHRALEIARRNPDALAVLGAVEQIRGSDSSALTLYTEALAHSSRNATVLTRLGFLYFINFRNTAHGVKLLKDAEEAEPYSPDIQTNLGIAYAMTKQYKEAIRCFERAVVLKPTESDFHRNLGYFHERLGEREPARDSYARALELDSTNPDNYVSLANVLLHESAFDEAVKVLQDGRSKLGDLNIIYMLGYVFLQSGRTSQAESAFREGLALVESRITKPRGATAENYALLALFNARLGRSPEATRAVGLAQQTVDATDDIVLLDIARTYAILGKSDVMLAYFDKAHQQRPIDYDRMFLQTAVDFERYRDDPRLIAIASK